MRRPIASLAVVAAVAVSTVLAAPAAANTIGVAIGAVAIAHDGKCSLAEAILNANDTATGQPQPDCAAGDPAGADTIVLAGGVYLETAQLDGSYGASGLPAITSDVTIEGHGSVLERPSSYGACVRNQHRAGLDFRLLAARHGFVRLHGLVFRRGCSNDFGTYVGGAIFTTTRLELVNVEVSASEALLGGGIASFGGSVEGSHVRVHGNTGLQGGGGFGFFVLSDSRIFDNHATLEGGGLAGSGHLIRTAITGNAAARFGGGLSGSFELDQSSVTANQAHDGGGLAIHWSSQSATIRQSLIANNRAARFGGGIYNRGYASAIDTTLAGNVAGNAGGAVYDEGRFDDETRQTTAAVTTLSFCTVAGNQASAGGGVLATFGEIRPKNTVIAGNAGGDCELPFFGFGTLCSLGANFDSDGTCRVNGACGQANVPLFARVAASDLRHLGAWGGPTESRPPLGTSPLVDAAHDCTEWTGGAIAADQRGVPRPQGDACDAGAVELGTPQ